VVLALLTGVMLAGFRQLRALKQLRADLVAATAAREASERKHREILDRSLQGFYQVTRDGRFLAANPTMARITSRDVGAISLPRVGAMSMMSVRCILVHQGTDSEA